MDRNLIVAQTRFLRRLLLAIDFGEAGPPAFVALRVDASVEGFAELAKDGPCVPDDADIDRPAGDLLGIDVDPDPARRLREAGRPAEAHDVVEPRPDDHDDIRLAERRRARVQVAVGMVLRHEATALRTEEHTSELQSLMRNSYAVFW